MLLIVLNHIFFCTKYSLRWPVRVIQAKILVSHFVQFEFQTLKLSPYFPFGTYFAFILLSFKWAVGRIYTTVTNLSSFWAHLHRSSHVILNFHLLWMQILWMTLSEILYFFTDSRIICGNKSDKRISQLTIL